MPTYSLQAPNGKTYEIEGPAGATPDDVRAEILRRDPSAGTASIPRDTAPAAPSLLASGGRGLIDPLTVAGQALRVLRAPVKAAFDVAGQADVAAGIKTPEQAASRAQTYANIPIPMLVGMLTGGASLPAQSIIQMGTTKAMQEGGLEPQSTGQVIASGAMPFVGEGISRVVRGLGRTAVRTLPGLFRRAQEQAQGALGQVTAGLATEEATPLFKAARAAGEERIGARQLTAMLDDLDQTIPKDPISPGLKTAREFMERGRELTQGGAGVSLGDLMRFRQDLGPMTRQVPQIQALYKATLGDLEAGSTAGSRLAVEALSAARKTHGAALFSDLVEKATDIRSVSGADVPTLNVAKLAKSVHANQDELVKFLGPSGVGRIEQFLAQYRSLPPTHAWTAVNRAIGTLAGGAGFLGAGPAGLVGAALPELATNIFQVGANPAALAASRLVPLLAAARAGAATGQPQR